MGLGSFFAVSNSKATPEKNANVAVPGKAPQTTKNQSRQQYQLMMQMQQQQYAKAQLISKYEERQKIQDALDSVYQRVEQAKTLHQSSRSKDAAQAERMLKKRQSALAEEIKRLESHLKNKF